MHRIVAAPRVVSAIVLLAIMVGSRACLAQVVDEEHSETIDLSEADRPIVEENLDLEKVVAHLFEQTNELREHAQSSPVTMQQQLADAAGYFASYMAEHDKYGHTADKRRPAERAAMHDYEYCIVSENIAYQYSSRGFAEDELAANFMTAWEDSPQHYKNIVDKDVMEIGVAVARSQKTGYYYAVQMFGRPKSASLIFRIVNRSGETIEYEVGKHRLPLPTRYTRVHEECRPGPVIFHLPTEKDEQTQTVAFTPESGDELILMRTDGKLAVRKKARE